MWCHFWYNFCPLTAHKIVGVWSKHLWIFSGESLAIFRKCFEMFVWPSDNFWRIFRNLLIYLEVFGKYLEIFRKSTRTLSCIMITLYNKIKQKSHGHLEIWIYLFVLKIFNERAQQTNEIKLFFNTWRATSYVCAAI